MIIFIFGVLYLCHVILIVPRKKTHGLQEAMRYDVKQVLEMIMSINSCAVGRRCEMICGICCGT